MDVVQGTQLHALAAMQASVARKGIRFYKKAIEPGGFTGPLIKRS